MLERLLIVGLGSIGRRHARLAQELCPGVRVTALRHTQGGDPPAGIDVVHTMAEALATRPQAAVIASPAPHHLAPALALADAGVPLLIEKPLAASTMGVDGLIETCARRSVPLLLGYNLRYLSPLRELRRHVHQGAVGRVLSVRAEVGQFLPSWRPGMDYRASVSARAALGGGVLLELSHEIDYLLWMFGDVAWVHAVLRRQSGLEIDVEDTAHLVMGFTPTDDRPAIVAAVNLDFVRHDSTRTCTVIGDRGTVRWSGTTGRLEIFDADATAWRVLSDQPPERDATYVAEWRHFLACIFSGAAPAVTGADGLAVLNVIEAARRSAASETIQRMR